MTQVNTLSLNLRCSSCNSELEIHYIHMVTETSPPGARIVAIKPHTCPDEEPVSVLLPCDLTEGCCRKGVEMDQTTHTIYLRPDGLEVVLLSLNFHPECCPHWLNGNSCDRRHS